MSPIGQLNLLIWLSWPRPYTASPLRPLLREAGYELVGLGMDLDVPSDLYQKAKAAGVAIKRAVNPDLVLYHADDARVLTVECKANSFGAVPPLHSSGKPSPSHSAFQAAALLAMAGPHLAKTIGYVPHDHWTAYVLYVTGAGKEPAVHTTLGSISSALAAAGVAPTDSGAVGIEVRPGDGIYLTPAASAPLPVATLAGGPERALKLDAEDTGETLQIVPLLPYDPSIGDPDPFHKKVFEERLRAAIASAIGRQVGPRPFEVTLDQVLQDAVEVWSLWKDGAAKRGLREKAKRYVQSVASGIAEFVKANALGVEVSFERGRLRVGKAGTSGTRRMRGYLESASFRRGNFDFWGPPAEQLELPLYERRGD